MSPTAPKRKFSMSDDDSKQLSGIKANASINSMPPRIFKDTTTRGLTASSSSTSNIATASSASLCSTTPSPSPITPNPFSRNTLDTHLLHALSNATTLELNAQLRTYLLTRATSRLITFWRRHKTSLQDLSDGPPLLLSAAQAYVAKHAVDEQGNLKDTFEASYKTGPVEKEGNKAGRDKYEVFEMIEVTYKGEGREVGVSYENWEMELLRKKGHEVVERLVFDDVQGFWPWVVTVKGECEEAVEVEARKQGVEWKGDDDLGLLKWTKGMDRAVKLMGVRVAVEARKKLVMVGIFERQKAVEEVKSKGKNSAEAILREVREKLPPAQYQKGSGKGKQG